MPIKDQRVYWRPRAYKPNVPYTGDNADYIFKGLNLIPNGTGADFYYRMFRGIETQIKPLPMWAMTGTVGIATTGVMTGVGGIQATACSGAMDTGRRTHLQRAHDCL